MIYKESFYNINVYNEKYTDNPAYEDLYYNTLSGNFAHITATSNLDDADLKAKKMAVPENVDEPLLYNRQQEKAIKDDFPSHVFLTVSTTMKCNYDCAYCFETSKKGKHLEGEVLEDTINYIKTEIDRNPNLKSLGIRWFGGEPLLNIPAIEKISEIIIPYCQERNITYKAQITTNGYFFTKEVSKRLKELKVESAQIALDGFEKTYISTRKAPKDAFRQVLQNITDSVIPVSIRINTTRKNQDEIMELVKELYRSKETLLNDKNKVNISRVKEYEEPLHYGFTDTEWLEFRERITDLKDIMGMQKIADLGKMHIIPCVHNQRRNVFISPDGYLYRCDFMISDPKDRIGSLKEGIIDNNATDKDFVKSTITEECLRCKFLPICCGGLCRYAELRQGKPCELTKGRFRQNMINYLKYVYKKP